MKKKFMMVTLLLGTLMLGACVDDNETASVSAVREATAKQLKSVAAMNRAEAEATKALADAEVALMQAKAAAEKANAELDKAKAEMKLKQAELIELKKESQSITNQEAQARLEEDLALLEKAQLEAQQSLAQIAADMQAAEIKAQAAMLVAQKELLQAQQALLDSEADLAEAKTEAEREAILAQKRALEALASKYSSAVESLLSAKSSYNSAVSSLVSLENGLITAQEAKEQQIVKNNNKIAQYEARIEAYKQYVNYTEDLQALRNQRDELIVKQNLLKDDYFAAKKAYNEIVLDNTASIELTDSLENKDKFSTFARWSYEDYGSWQWGYYYIGDEWHSTDWTILQIIKDYIAVNQEPMASDFVTLPTKYFYETIQSTDNLGDTLAIQYFPTIPDLRGEAELRVDNELAWRKDRIKSNQDKLPGLERWYNGEATEADYERDGSETKSCRNLVDSTAYLKAKYEAETDATVKAQYRSAYESALALETAKKQEIDNAYSDIEYYEKTVAEILDQWDMLKNYATYQEELQKAMDKRNELQVAEYAEKVAAWFDMMEKDAAWQEVQNEIDAINAVIYGNNNSEAGGDSEDGIWGIAARIKDYESMIETLKAQNEDFSTIETKEQAIAAQKEVIAVWESQVKVWEILVAQTKADLDAALAKSEGAEE